MDTAIKSAELLHRIAKVVENSLSPAEWLDLQHKNVTTDVIRKILKIIDLFIQEADGKAAPATMTWKFYKAHDRVEYDDQDEYEGDVESALRYAFQKARIIGGDILVVRLGSPPLEFECRPDYSYELRDPHNELNPVVVGALIEKIRHSQRLEVKA